MNSRAMNTATLAALIDLADQAHLPWFTGSYRCSENYEALLQFHTNKHGPGHPQTMETLTYVQIADGFEGLDEDGRLARLEEAEPVLRNPESGDPYVLGLNLAGQGFANYMGGGDHSTAAAKFEEALRLLAGSPTANPCDVWLVAEHLADCLNGCGQPLAGIRVLDDHRPLVAKVRNSLDSVLRHLELRAVILDTLYDSDDQGPFESYRATGAPSVGRDAGLAAVLAQLASVAVEEGNSRSRLRTPPEREDALASGRAAVDGVIELVYSNRDLKSEDLECIKILLGKVATQLDRAAA